MDVYVKNLFDPFIGKPVELVLGRNKDPFFGIVQSVTIEEASCYNCGKRSKVILLVKDVRGPGTTEVDLLRDSQAVLYSKFDGRNVSDELALLREELMLSSAVFEAIYATESDFLVKADDGTVIRAHKLILRARSPVFAAMLDLDMKEKNEGCVMVKGFTGQGLEIFVLALYNKLHPKMKQHMGEFMQLLHIYEVGSLLSVIPQAYFRSILDEKNAAEVLFMAGRNGDTDVMEFAMETISKRKKEVLASPGWIKWSQSAVGFAPAAWKLLMDWI